MMRRGFGWLATAIGLAPIGAARAQTTIIGRWEVRHGQLGHIYVFEQNGRYSYQRYAAVMPGASPQTVGRESGTYSVRGNHLTIKPTQEAQRTYQFRIGCGPQANPILLPGECALFLSSQGGGEEMFISG
jgi:hypothetical protein